MERNKESILKAIQEEGLPVKSFLKGFAYNAGKHSWKGSMNERRLLEQLVEWGIVDKTKHYPGDKSGMYHVRNWRDYSSVEDLVEKRLKE